MLSNCTWCPRLVKLNLELSNPQLVPTACTMLTLQRNLLVSRYSDYHKAQATRVAAAAVRRRRLVVAAAAFAAVTAVALWAKRR